MDQVQARMRSVGPPRLDGRDRSAVHEYFENTWELYELLFSSIVGDGALYKNPDPLRQPLIFYLGHTAAFYVNKLRLAGAIESGIREDFEQLFAVGVDPATAAELGAETWPEEAEVRGFRDAVFRLVSDFIEGTDFDRSITPDSELWALMMGLEHDRIHFETSSVLIRQYAARDVRCPDGWTYAPSNGEGYQRAEVSVTGDAVTLGRAASSTQYGWDNEYGRLDVAVADFGVDSHPVTNADYLAFWRDGGYDRRDLWDDEGWAWKRDSGSTAPQFWVLGEEAPRYRAMFDVIDLPPDWPVEVNQLEAQAFCRWRGGGARLMTEAEFHLVARNAPNGGPEPIGAGRYNHNLEFGSPSPVGHLRDGVTSDGVHDLFGNVWEWLADDHGPYPGFESHPIYREYSEPFMDSDHAMLAGGSWASTGTSASANYRQWFRRYFIQHAGFRTARSD